MNQVLEEQQPIPAGDSSEVATAVMPPQLHSDGHRRLLSSEQAKVKPKEIDQRLLLLGPRWEIHFLDMTVLTKHLS